MAWLGPASGFGPGHAHHYVPQEAGTEALQDMIACLWAIVSLIRMASVASMLHVYMLFFQLSFKALFSHVCWCTGSHMLGMSLILF